ncbi:MAG TPA: hypothetical protein VFT53_07255 [Candidatus Saccharimonadales bacterium]|nr:hypothetical protein [Candidatus Saccharimonadales bacterium]
MPHPDNVDGGVSAMVRYDFDISGMQNILRSRSVGLLLGLVLVAAPLLLQPFRAAGLSSVGAILGIAFVVCSLFGDLPAWISWTQRLGAWLFAGIAVGTVIALLVYIFPSSGRESSFYAISPAVWAAYLSIVLVTLLFRFSSIPRRMYALVQRIDIKPSVVIPVFVTIAGVTGNILDGVTIISISVIIFLGLLERKWALRASFALLFGGLISNLITVAAEPTNIKFDEIMHAQLAHIHPYYWFTNWPISILGIALPAALLAIGMFRANVAWKSPEPDPQHLYKDEEKVDDPKELALSTTAIVLLGLGVILHAVFTATHFLNYAWPLWQLLLPAGIASLIGILYLRRSKETREHFRTESPVWLKLMIIFSLLWLIVTVCSQYPNISSVFFVLPFPLQYICMVVLSLLSAVTDNVALASMQGSIMMQHPIAIWQMRLLFVLLTWAGGLTPFGCLQALSLNSHIKLSTKQWVRETPVWAGSALAGGLIGLAIIRLVYPPAF